MRDTHRGMNISDEEYATVTDDIMQMLAKHDIDEQTRQEVLTIVESLKGDIAHL